MPVAGVAVFAVQWAPDSPRRQPVADISLGLVEQLGEPWHGKVDERLCTKQPALGRTDEPGCQGGVLLEFPPHHREVRVVVVRDVQRLAPHPFASNHYWKATDLQARPRAQSLRVVEETVAVVPDTDEQDHAVEVVEPPERRLPSQREAQRTRRGEGNRVASSTPADTAVYIVSTAPIWSLQEQQPEFTINELRFGLQWMTWVLRPSAFRRRSPHPPSSGMSATESSAAGRPPAS